LAYKKKKLLFRDGNKLNVGDGHSGRAPWLAVNQCHFAKNIVSREIGHRSVADLNAHVTALDNEKLVSPLAFAENDTTGSYSACLDVITSQDAKACIGRHCQLPNPNDRGDVSSITNAEKTGSAALQNFPGGCKLVFLLLTTKKVDVEP
jgi:hypothetical protein